MRRAYLIAGAGLVLAGLLGFVQNPVFGLFEVTVVHNLIHLASGVLTLMAAREGIGAMRVWGKAFGFVYLLVAITGWIFDGDLLGMMHLNRADNVLHFLLAGFFLYFGLLAPPR